MNPYFLPLLYHVVVPFFSMAGSSPAYSVFDWLCPSSSLHLSLALPPNHFLPSVGQLVSYKTNESNTYSQCTKELLHSRYFVCLYACMPSPYLELSDHGSQKRVSVPLGLELQGIVSHHVGPGNQTWVLWENNQGF